MKLLEISQERVRGGGRVALWAIGALRTVAGALISAATKLATVIIPG